MALYSLRQVELIKCSCHHVFAPLLSMRDKKNKSSRSDETQARCPTPSKYSSIQHPAFGFPAPLHFSYSKLASESLAVVTIQLSGG